MTVTRLPVVVLCGSARFGDDIARVERELSLAGHPVIAYSLPLPGEPPLTVEQVRRLTERHFAAIALADEVWIVNRDGYVGDSTRGEIEFARRLGKAVRYLFSDPAQPAINAAGRELVELAIKSKSITDEKE